MRFRSVCQNFLLLSPPTQPAGAPAAWEAPPAPTPNRRRRCLQSTDAEFLRSLRAVRQRHH
jgi:hypothetical protein